MSECLPTETETRCSTARLRAAPVREATRAVSDARLRARPAPQRSACTFTPVYVNGAFTSGNRSVSSDFLRRAQPHFFEPAPTPELQSRWSVVVFAIRYRTRRLSQSAGAQNVTAPHPTPYRTLWARCFLCYYSVIGTGSDFLFAGSARFAMRLAAARED